MRCAQPIQRQATYREQKIPDGVLVTQALAGDHSAFDVLVNRYRNLLASYVGEFLPDHEQVLDELRRMRRHAALPFSMLAWEDGEEESVVAAIRDPDPLPEEVVEKSDQYCSLHKAIAALPPKFRSIVFLHCFRQLTFPEIGCLLHLPDSTVKSYYYRSLPHLHRRLSADVHFTSVS